MYLHQRHFPPVNSAGLGGFGWVIDVPLEFIPEMPDGTGYRPGSGIAEWTNGVPFDLFRHVDQQIDVMLMTVSVLDAVQDFFHPACSFPAGAALSTRLVVIEP